MLPPEIGQDLSLLHPGWIAKRQPYKKAIQLRLWKRESPFIFDRILRGQHQERTGQIPRNPVHGHLLFLHRLQQGSLRTRCSAVDLIRQKDVHKNGTGIEFKFALLLIVDRYTGNIIWK